MSGKRWQVLGGSAVGALMLGGLVFAVTAEPAEERQPSTGYSYSQCIDDLAPDAGDADTVEQLNALIAGAEQACADLK